MTAEKLADEIIQFILAVLQNSEITPEARAHVAALLLPRLSASNVSGERDIKRTLAYFGITYCNDLADEGTPWECAAEPEPQYFETLKEALEFRDKLMARAADVSAERERCAKIVEQAFSGVGGSSIADRIRRGEK